jgi:DNA primase catalytic core
VGENQTRLLQVVQDAGDILAAQYPGSWAQSYVAQRLGGEVAHDPAWSLGCALAGWDALTVQLRGRGWTDEDLVAAGVSIRTRRGTVVDLFRDRVTIPVHDTAGRALSFVGRARPGTDQPKYLNGPDTAIYRKGEHLLGLGWPRARTLLEEHVTRVALVEGPFDAIAVTAATRGQFVGAAALGTAFTEDQADLLSAFYARTGLPTVVALDDDPAGRRGQERAFALLTARGQRPLTAAFAVGLDPADTLTYAGADDLAEAPDDGGPLLDRLLTDRLDDTLEWQHRSIEDAFTAAAWAVAPLGHVPAGEWSSHIGAISQATGLLPQTVHEIAVRTSVARTGANADA